MPGGSSQFRLSHAQLDPGPPRSSVCLFQGCVFIGYPFDRLDYRIAAMHLYGMAQVLPVSKRGTITLPPAYRRKLGLDRMANPLVLAEEKNGRLILEVATAVPVRDIPEGTIRGWIAEDERAGAALRKKGLLGR